MIDSMRIIVIAEKTGVKQSVVEILGQTVSTITCVDAMADGLLAVKRNHYDAAILSNDMKDYYSTESMVKSLQEVGSIQYIVLISELEKPVIAGDNKHLQSMLIESPNAAATEITQVLEALSTVMERGVPLQKDSFPTGSEEQGEVALFDSVPTGLYRIDLEGNFIDLNKTFVAMFRALNPDVLLSDNYFSMFNDPDEKHTWLDIIKRDNIIHGLIYEIERYDGQVIWVRDTVRAVLDSSGKQKYYDGSVEDITFQKKLDDKLSFLATQDILTGLPNRNFFQDQAKLTISQARYNEDLVAFLVLDLDHFSVINETYGYKTGDRILQIVASRTKIQLRKSDLVSRLGSDKFIALLSGIRNRRDVLAIAKKINQVFSMPFSVLDNEISISASIGISLFPEHGDDINTLIKRAEIATFAVKERERGGYMIYTDVIHTSYDDEK
ncbi:PAS domain S-box/diguanylate cyclase (GGDEF) domain-containing protein [Sphaerochaeta pleomorpha str. Grapes]|uniref:PAS domain S-box/diguanylate cyclase (GGDEF) domain-containing protein n=1 Tax=Sphaerochaeta pleomorpha (strain ATCC BAA-1885 / DSM 22778 / Grapes) TaxID=158190 RepID=G8QSA9_SPHPG|nr:sensor domain-containing diguanylate cyclase [Sphaerochaeta pleomorpha]AEV30039.1 PAS domain S-box/diguanylate cyclase (GGDEF) domain-containing protein [Sphaerochaeta pleomorpha str. Grapes]